MPQNALERFSDRVGDYARYRPGYPAALITCLETEFGLRREQPIADVGSGTGISAALFLDLGCDVFAIEPNDAMRAAAERQFAGNARFHSIAARAEATTLPDASVDWVVAAQAFHWFDVPAAQREFRRILRPSGRVALFWNDRVFTSAFDREYESFLRTHAIDYSAVNHQGDAAAERVARFFSPGQPQERRFENVQVLNLDGLRGRVRSCSYMPNAGHARYPEMSAALDALFSRHAACGQVRITYETRLHVGRPAGGPKA